MSPAMSETGYLPIMATRESNPDESPIHASTAEAAAAEEEVSYTIDELAAQTRVPSRTIRFYQARGVLDRPIRKGRKAVYTHSHVQRLEIIAQLQDRGLRLRGMKQLLLRRDSDAAVAEWLGLSEKLAEPWTEEKARVVNDAEMSELLGERPAGTLAAVLRSGLASRRDDSPNSYFIPSPGLLDVALRLLDGGITLHILANLEPILRSGLRDAAEGVVDYFVEQEGLSDVAEGEELTRNLDALRTLGAKAVSLIFAQEVERTLSGLLEEGKPNKRNRRRRKPARRR